MKIKVAMFTHQYEKNRNDIFSGTTSIKAINSKPRKNTIRWLARRGSVTYLRYNRCSQRFTVSEEYRTKV